jgi:hypothetical protein
MGKPIYIDDWKYIHVWRIEVYRSKGEITPLRDIYYTRSFRDNEPLDIVEESIAFGNAKELIGKYQDPIFTGWVPHFDEIQRFSIGYLLDSVKEEIRKILKKTT